jgi:class 3 adenylate cyclase
MVRSTNLVEAIGDDAWVDLLRWHDQTLRDLFARHGGQEIDHAGDGFFVVFERPEDGISCAVAIQRTLADHRRKYGFAPSVRIGVHSAPATKSGGAYVGKGVHEAARIASAAGAGEIVASVQSLEGHSELFVVTNTREVTLKGVEKPIEVATLDWRAVGQGHG